MLILLFRMELLAKLLRVELLARMNMKSARLAQRPSKQLMLILVGRLLGMELLQSSRGNMRVAKPS